MDAVVESDQSFKQPRWNRREHSRAFLLTITPQLSSHHGKPTLILWTRLKKFYFSRSTLSNIWLDVQPQEMLLNFWSPSRIFFDLFWSFLTFFDLFLLVLEKEIHTIALLLHIVRPLKMETQVVPLSRLSLSVFDSMFEHGWWIIFGGMISSFS